MEFVKWGYSPRGGEQNFAVSPKQFCRQHGLSPCQGGVVYYLSRYCFERNTWLLEQSILLLNLIIDYGYCHHRVRNWIRKKLGFEVYLAPVAQYSSINKMSISAYCAINGIGPEFLLPLKLICGEPSEEGIIRAKELIIAML